jgi:hypothetical protein
MSEANELNWKKYETITKYIYEVLGKEFGVKIEGFGDSCKVVGKSGVTHQIDVLTAYSDGIHSYRTAIECKYWEKKITKDIVMKVAEIIDDAGINKGVIVSKSGFTQDGFDFARYKNIGLVELRELDKKDLEETPGKIDLGTLEVRVRSSLLRPEILSTTIDYAENILEQREEINIYATAIRLSNGNLAPFTSYTTMFQNELHHQNKLFQPITRRYEISGSLINQRTNTSAQINGVVFTGVLKKIDSGSDLKFSLVDQVWLIMKSIFEERVFQMSKAGLIVEISK